ncbi:hypothetical protein SNE40_017839 [Patella caerulea]|uniref:Uncharacterized protein n=1 Tax=Patella caerulea TaxID=87958 RepID=A0AAN8PMV5_PATCE
MDFSKFRESGELSDITVVVDGAEFKLHKFPLYAKSDYFRNLTKDKNSKEDIVRLNDFPGGSEMFGMIADFCYNMALPMTKNSVVQIRCAASRLEMEGPGNLGDLADKYLQDTITSAKLSRSIQSIVTLLLNCGKIGPVAEKTGIVSMCVDALVECWLKPPTKFSSFTSRLDSTEDKTTSGLCSLPVEWFVKILVKAQEDGVRMSELASLAVQYVSRVLEPDVPIKKENAEGDTEEQNEDDTKPQPTVLNEKREAEVAKVLDAVLLALPEESYNLPYITPEWLTKVLRIATTHGCSCRDLLVKVAGEMFNTLSAEDLCTISPSVVRDIVVEAAKDPNQSEQACKLVDTYTSEMARKEVLTSETFKLLTSAAPQDGRKDNNQLYNVLEYILKTEKDTLTDDQIKELIQLVNFSQLNEVTLQKAFDSDVIPDREVAKGALALCQRLKRDMDNMKYNGTLSDTSSPGGAVSLSRLSREPSKVFSESLKTGTEGEDPVKAAADVLMAARSKLAGPLYSSYSRQYHSHPSGASHVPAVNPYQSTLDDDTSLDDDYDYRYERAYRNLDARSRPRSYVYSDHKSYFPYSSRY